VLNQNEKEKPKPQKNETFVEQCKKLTYITSEERVDVQHELFKRDL